MRHPGIEEELCSVAFEPPTLQFRLYNSGKVLQALSFAKDTENATARPT